MRRQEKLIWATLLLLICLSLTSIFIAVTKGPGNYSYPSATPTPVNYDKIGELIDQKLATLPKAPAGIPGVNGNNGVNGTDGKDGKNGATGLQGPAGPKGDTGEKGDTGAQGDPGIPGKTVELRYNDTKQQIEWRYGGDIGWRTLVTTCQLGGTC